MKESSGKHRKPIFNPSRRAVLRQSGFMAAGLALGPAWLRTASAQSASFDYYISPSGSNNNPGTQAQPWAITALADASKTQIRGKRIGLLDGNYVITTTLNQGAQIMIPVVHAGTASSPTVIQSVNPRGAVLTNNNNGSWTTYPNNPAVLGVLPGVDYVTFRDLRFQSLSWCAIYVQSNYVRIEGCDIFDIDLTRVAGYPSAGDNIGAIYTGSGGHDLVISNCRIEKVNNGARKSTGTNANACALGPFFHYSNITVENCSLFDATVGVHFKDDYSGATVRNCYFHSNIDSGIWGINARSAARPVAKNAAYNNVFNRQNQWLANSYGDMQADCDVYNNTFIAGPNVAAHTGGIMFEPAGHANPGNAWALNFYNNIVYFPAPSSAYTIVFKQSYPTTSAIKVMDYNIYPTGFAVRDDNSGGASYNTLAAWRSHIGGKEANSQTTGAVQFLNVSGSSPTDYQLASTSVGNLVGRVSGLASGTAIDVGAWIGGTTVGHNFTSGLKIPNPPTSVDVS